MPNRQLDDHADLVPHFATRAEIAELREKVMSLQTIVRALAEKNGAAADLLQDWALCMGQFKSEPGRALATAQRVAASIGGHPASQVQGVGGLPLRVPANAPK
jgi:hypothetical protein